MTNPHIWNKEKIGSLLLRASVHALQMQKDINPKEKQISAVLSDLYTDADVVIENIFIDELENQDEQRYVVGEETIAKYTNTRCTNRNDKNKSLVDVLSHTAYVIDPIDGTLNYYNKLPNWGVSIGLVQNNCITEGGVIIPSLGEMLVSENNTVYFAAIPPLYNHTDEHVFDISLHTPCWTVVSKSEPNFHDVYSFFVRAYDINETFPDAKTPYHIHRSSVYSAAKVLMGQYWGFIDKSKLWDLAACMGLFKNLGRDTYYIQDNQLHILPYDISTTHWHDLLYAQHNIVFAHSDTYAKRFLNSGE